MKVLRKLIFTSVVLISGHVHAAEYVGQVATIAAGPQLGSNLVLVRVVNHSPQATWSTSCATNTFWSFVFDVSTSSGKAAYAQLLAAYIAGKDVVIGGLGTCGLDGTIQNLGYTRFN